MFAKSMYEGTREENYSLLVKQLEAVIHDESNRIANLSNAAALLQQFLEHINWVGFYLVDESGDGLVLGPFQGLPACVRIPFGKGVCGTSAQNRETVRVPDVHEFPGHIACDAASLSEIVIPILKGNELLGVLDIDSPIRSRFDEMDQRCLEQFVEVLVTSL